jgi:hypothetical protein
MLSVEDQISNEVEKQTSDLFEDNYSGSGSLKDIIN